MNDEELEQKSIEYELKECGINANQKLRQAYMDGFRDCLKEWHKNYLSCSSPYCSSFFADVPFKGELGNMPKEQTKGKTIQQKVGDEWFDLSDPTFAGFDAKLYRVKPSEKYNEIFKLKSLLEENHIPFEWIEHNRYDKQGYQICYPEKGEKRVCSVIEHSFSYGHEKDLLEIQGLLTADEEECDSVLGNLTADDVFQRILSHWKGTKEKTTYRPFKSCDELIETWKNMMNKVLGVNESFIKTDLDEPTVWVKHKVDGRRRMIVGFGENFVEFGSMARTVTLEQLFEMYTFLDGTPIGVEE